MNTKLAVFLFIISVFVVGISSYFLFVPNMISYTYPWVIVFPLIFFMVGVSYIHVSVIFAVIHNYHFFKTKVYQEPLDFFKKIIERDPKWSADLLSFIAFGTAFNFFTVSLFKASPLISILEELPYFHLINLPLKLDDNLFGNSLTSTDVAFMLIIIFTGPIFLFVLRQLHYKLTSDYVKRYPGSRILVIFFEVVPAIIFINILSHYIQTGTFVISSNSFADIIKIVMNVVMTFGLIISAIVWVFDRKLFAR